MAKVEQFEDLIAWQKGRALVRDIYAVSERRPFSRDFALRNQIRDAAVSVPSNIAEGFERAAHGETFKSLMAKAREAGRVIGGLRKSIERQRNTQHSALSTQRSE